MRIRVEINIDDETTGTNVSVEDFVIGDASPQPVLAELLESARRKAEATLSVDDACEEADNEDDTADGVKVGTAYVEVRPDFSAFDSEEFERAVKYVVDNKVCHWQGEGSGRAFRP